MQDFLFSSSAHEISWVRCWLIPKVCIETSRSIQLNIIKYKHPLAHKVPELQHTGGCDTLESSLYTCLFPVTLSLNISPWHNGSYIPNCAATPRPKTLHGGNSCKAAQVKPTYTPHHCTITYPCTDPRQVPVYQHRQSKQKNDCLALSILYGFF